MKTTEDFSKRYGIPRDICEAWFVETGVSPIDQVRNRAILIWFILPVSAVTFFVFGFFGLYMIEHPEGTLIDTNMPLWSVGLIASIALVLTLSIFYLWMKGLPILRDWKELNKIMDRHTPLDDPIAGADWNEHYALIRKKLEYVSGQKLDDFAKTWSYDYVALKRLGGVFFHDHEPMIDIDSDI